MIYGGWSTSISFPKEAIIVAAVALVSALFATQVRAQISGFGRSSAPVFGGVGIAPQPVNPYPPMRGTFADPHKTPDGKPCISVFPTARPQIVNPRIIDQIVTVNNVCGQSIRVQVCYAKSSDCIVVPLEGYQKLERVLGIASGSTGFKYEYRELF
jgi:hypothetical protein